MPRFLIEVPHENRKDACDFAVRIFLETGSHFMTNADWGCGDDVHKAWFVVELESRDQALSILPAVFRKTASIIELQRFTLDDLNGMRSAHRP